MKNNSESQQTVNQLFHWLYAKQGFDNPRSSKGPVCWTDQKSKVQLSMAHGRKKQRQANRKWLEFNTIDKQNR